MSIAEGSLYKLYKIGYYRKQGKVKELLIKENKWLFLDHDFFEGEGNSQGGGGVFYHANYFLLWDTDRAHVTDGLFGVEQKIPNWLIKIISLGETETAIGSGIKSRFCIMGFITCGAIWGLQFSLHRLIL